MHARQLLVALFYAAPRFIACATIKVCLLNNTWSVTSWRAVHLSLKAQKVSCFLETKKANRATHFMWTISALETGRGRAVTIFFEKLRRTVGAGDGAMGTFPLSCNSSAFHKRDVAAKKRNSRDLNVHSCHAV